MAANGRRAVAFHRARSPAQPAKEGAPAGRGLARASSSEAQGAGPGRLTIPCAPLGQSITGVRQAPRHGSVKPLLGEA